MYKTYIRIGWSLYFPILINDSYMYVDTNGYNPDGYKWNGKDWIDNTDYNVTGFQYLTKNEESEEVMSIILNNSTYCNWELKKGSLIEL